MSNASKTEQLVRRCFGNGNISSMIGSWKIYARAARRFVRMEQAEKFKTKRERYLKWCKKYGEKVDLPKHFGEMRKVKGSEG